VCCRGVSPGRVAPKAGTPYSDKRVTLWLASGYFRPARFSLRSAFGLLPRFSPSLLRSVPNPPFSPPHFRGGGGRGGIDRCGGGIAGRRRLRERVWRMVGHSRKGGQWLGGLYLARSWRGGGGVPGIGVVRPLRRGVRIGRCIRIGSARERIGCSARTDATIRDIW
jgi:hypothetical protein